MNTPLSPAMTAGRRAFTLIELLTVIAIIGILAAIIIPTVGAVRAAANETKSLSNLRQIALAMNTYANDNRDRFPPGYYYKPGDGERIWTTELSSYVGMKSPVYTANDNIYVSPLAKIPVVDGSEDGGVIPCTYSVHGLLSPDISGGDTRLPRGQVLRPTQVILVGEGTQRPGTYAYANASFGSPSQFTQRNASNDLAALIPTDTDVDGVGGALRYRGRSGVPVGFVDGHVESLKKGSVNYGHIIADR